MMMEWDLPLVLFSLISNLAAIYGITATHQRTSLIKAGLVVGSVNAVIVLGLLSASGRPVPVSHIALQMSCGLLGGILVAVLVSFLLPVLESLFNILTDIRLLELSNLNNPLVRRLAVEAPGSYNHSVIVGTLAEAAAESIGANALFCRVAAYYHDVGKMLKPDYFVENQRTSDNRHDTLSPHMSALVITSHVKEGFELAKSYGLPRQVRDIIPQHHGTRKINFFFQKAKRSEAQAGEEVREPDYRRLLGGLRGATRCSGAGIPLLLTSDRSMRRLNREFRGKDQTPVVVSFPAVSDLEPGRPHLGEIAISLPRAGRQARRADWRLRDELALLVTHGYLHLLGYDHEKDDGAMHRLEERLLLRTAGVVLDSRRAPWGGPPAGPKGTGPAAPPPRTGKRALNT